MAVTLTRLEANNLLERATERVEDCKSPNFGYVSFWNTCIEYGAWAVNDNDYTRLQCSTPGSGHGGRSITLTDNQAMFIDSLVARIRNSGEEADKKAYESFRFCFMTSASDKRAISEFNWHMNRRCTGRKIKVNQLYHGELGYFFMALRCKLECELNSIILSN